MLEVDYAKRRKNLLENLKDSVALFVSPDEKLRNTDVYYKYRQSSDIYYLTGLSEPNTVVLFDAQSKHPTTLFVEPKNALKELWEGTLLGPKKAQQITQVDQAFASIPEKDLEEKFIEALLTCNKIYYSVGQDENWDRKVFSWMKKALRKLGRTGRPLWSIHDPKEILGEMRLIKSKAEIERIQKAASITADAHAAVMRQTRPGMYEYEIEAILFHSFRSAGALRLGYESIVAAGSNACILHYKENQSVLKKGELLLIDAGAEFDFYSADITRVTPISGHFSKTQKEIYQAVLKAQKECIQMAKPGITLPQIHEKAVDILIEELLQLKVLSGKKKDIISQKTYQQYYPHGTGHWLGMDVHDVGKYYVSDYKVARKLEAGMYFTIEPGLYFGSKTAASQYRGIGVRIEDDILVTEKGALVLTSGVPKEIDEIETLCAQNGR